MSALKPILSGLIIATALALTGIVGVILFVPGRQAWLPWALLLAGLLAVFNAASLRGARAPIRWTLGLVGLGTMVMAGLLGLNF